MRESSLSIGQKLDQTGGVGRGFDGLRLILATSVVAWHSFAVARDSIWLDGVRYVWMYGFAILSSFFALSGFLISASAQRLSLKNFLINRGLRIIPALLVEVALSAFVLGTVFTTLPLSAYFSSFKTYRYLTNVVGLINYELPGVFEANPVNAVNWSLWTVPCEYACYGIMSALIVLGLLRKANLVCIGAASIALIGIGLNAFGFHHPQGEGKLLAKAALYFFTDRGSYLLISFMVGIASYILRYRIPYNSSLAMLSVSICVVVSAFEPPDNYPLVSAIVAAPIAYLTAYLGVTNLPVPSVVRRGDYSYGIYLYGMPIQQAMVAVFPSVTSPELQFVLSIPCVFLFAIFSWHCIERPILKLRKNFSFIARERDVGGTKTTANPSLKTQID